MADFQHRAAHRITDIRSNIDKDPNLSPEQKVEYLLALKGAEEILAQGRRKYADTENSEIQKEYDNINTQLEKDRRKMRDKRYAGPDRLTDASYNRCETHSRNSFHNTRFNILAGLMHELDPTWFTSHFDSLNLVGLSGDRAQTTAFYNVDNFTKFMHENIVNNGYVPDTLKQQL